MDAVYNLKWTKKVVDKVMKLQRLLTGGGGGGGYNCTPPNISCAIMSGLVQVVIYEYGFAVEFKKCARGRNDDDDVHGNLTVRIIDLKNGIGGGRCLNSLNRPH
jgi:hypothetical protein